MALIFFSYRRSDTKHPTGRIYDRLWPVFGRECVFKDVDSIPVGSVFRTVLGEKLARCRVALVMIGPGWVTAAHPDGTRRLHDEDDLVRLEVEAVLAKDVAVIPVLLDGAEMPRRADLPESLRPLCGRHAAVIRDDPFFHNDVDLLIRAVREHLGHAPDPIDPPPAPPPALPPPPPAKQPPPGPRFPLAHDFADALLNPEAAFLLPDLRASRPERNSMGVPRARAGASGSVYRMTGPAGLFALKVFHFPSAERADRYRAASDYVQALGTRRPAALVGFEYHPEGIRVGTGKYPVLTMPWVKGRGLAVAARDALGKRPADAAAVRNLAGEWARAVKALRDAGIAHGSLDHDNALVTPEGRVVFVDYDALCVPALAGRECLEFGNPAYEHPGRRGARVGPHLDDFPAWAVMIALWAASADPALYDRFVTRTGNENLLFTEADLARPGESALWPELLRSPAREVREWAKPLRESLDKPFDQVPPFAPDPFDRLVNLVGSLPKK